ncbi:MAG TPA: PKD domain-containing protein [Candidatus Saccharimonadales bacterium]|nr:PKD domain-containing protein [Candidatus Saccharimonadales bacterium]
MRAFLLIGLFVPGALLLMPHHAAADALATCDGLSATLSDDKNNYIFRVAASGEDSDILGYTFNFGDHQTYRFTFGKDTGLDRHTAIVTHTFKDPGIFAASVTVQAKSGGHTTTIPSEDCKTTVAINLPDELPNTGTRNLLVLFVATALTGFAFRRLLQRLKIV